MKNRPKTAVHPIIIVYNGIMKKRYFFVLLVLTVAFGACTDFFSGSLATWAARDPDKLVPPVNADNVFDIIAEFENNPDASLAVLKRIQNALADAPDGEKITLQVAALEAAANAVGLVNAVFGAITDPDDIMEDSAKDIMLDVINGMTNLEAAGSLLLDVLPAPGTPEFKAFVASANPNDLAFAAVILLAGEAKRQPGDMGAYIDGFGATSNPVENLAIELAKAAQEHPDEMTGPMKDIIKGLNLA
jgi:hypothetical protein